MASCDQPQKTMSNPNSSATLPVGLQHTRAEIAAALLAQPAAVSPKYFYDALGSALFVAITELVEYYPTRCEAQIFSTQRAAIAQALHAMLPPEFALVDLGAGDGAKAAGWFEALKPQRYVAVDISEDFLQRAEQALKRQYPGLPMQAVPLDFSQQLTLPQGLLAGPALVFYPGSSIGNFDPGAALRLMRAAAAGGALMIGVDLLKSHAVLQAAYDDALGVTAAFNLNLLRHLNAVLGSDFDVTQWQHVALFNSPASRIEMHLQARQNLTVTWPGGQRQFAAGERIHTENSYKWAPADFEGLLREAGWHGVRRYSDERDWFGVFLAKA
jgi:L-histidine Nalpha-methyltransferase